MRAQYDVVVLGAGPAGLATAITIGRETRASVLVVDAGTAVRERFGESVAPDLFVPLKQLGLLDEFRAGGHAPCPGSASVWGGDRVGYNDYILNPTGPAWRLQRGAFDEMLTCAARESGAELCWATRFLQSLPDEKGHRLLLSNREGKSEVRGRWIVDATGPAARFALYAETRAHLYEIERRDGPFWQKRRERSRAMVVRERDVTGVQASHRAHRCAMAGRAPGSRSSPAPADETSQGRD